MCGVFGYFHSERFQLDREKIAPRLHALQLRGPDARGEHHDARSDIYHFRLRIQSPTPAADQPFWTHDSSTAISFNGQIYNHEELRQKLKDVHDVSFRTDSDTEVLIQAYKTWGAAAFSKLDGEFAGVIYEPHLRKVVIFRDSMGIRPLYIWRCQDQLAVSSLIEPLLHFQSDVRVNKNALTEHLTLRYSLGEKTIFDGIQRVLPGTLLTLDLSDFSESRQPIFQSAPSRKKLSATLNQAVSLRFPKDSPTTLFLSGGIDSLGLASIGSKNSTSLEVATLSLESGDLDSVLSATWAKENRTPHHELSLTKGDLFSRLCRLVLRMEEPIGDSVCLLQDELFEFALSRGKVAISGEGADELFGGYSHHLALHLWQKLRVPLKLMKHSAVRKQAVKLVQSFNPYPESLNATTSHELMTASAQSFSDMAFYLMSLLDQREISALVGSEEAHHVTQVFSSLHSLDDVLAFERSHWLPNYSLARVDKLGLSVGLEVRVPYLSTKVESAIKGQPLFRSWSLLQKVQLRKALKPFLAKKYLKQKKRPFTLVSGHPLTRSIVELAEKTLSEPRSLERSFWKPGGMRSVLNSPPDIFRSKKLVNLLMIEIWMRLYIDGDRQKLKK